MHYYSQIFVNYRLNSYFPGDCSAQGKLGLKEKHTTDKMVRENSLYSLFLLRDNYVMLDMGKAGKLVTPGIKREPRYFRKSKGSIFYCIDGKILSLNGLTLQYFDEKALDIVNSESVNYYGKTVEFYYPLEDSYIMAVNSPPIPGSNRSSFNIFRRDSSSKGGALLWEYKVDSGVPRPPMTTDGSIILAFPGKLVRCELNGNLKTLYKGEFGPIMVSLGEDNSLYMISLQEKGYFLTAFNSEGVRIWNKKLDIETYPTQPPIVSPNSMVYLIERTKIIAFRKGEKLWDYPLAKDGYREGSSQFATVLSDDTVLISDNNRVVYLNEFGEPIWIYKSDDKRPFRTQPILNENGHVVVANDQDIVIIK